MASDSEVRLLEEPAKTERAVARPKVRGKFIFIGDEKLYIRGVTYGPFRVSQDGSDYPEDEVVRQDFAQMAAIGINAVRTYTVPPTRLLDAAVENGRSTPFSVRQPIRDDRAS